jgi:hypothetical protein
VPPQAAPRAGEAPPPDGASRSRERDAPSHETQPHPAVPEPVISRQPAEEAASTQPAREVASAPASGAAPIELPVVSAALPSDSDLVLVETRHHAPPPVDAEEAPRGRRARPPRVEAASEPLEMVETRKDMPSASQ